jgi:hypothetical protein
LGKPVRDERSIFPLSPSTVAHEYMAGCSLPRWLDKVYGWRSRPHARLLRGRVVDAMLQHALVSNHSAKEWTEDECISLAAKMFHKEKRGYHFGKDLDPDSYLEQLIGMGLVVVRSLADLLPYSVQQKSMLYIGPNEEVEIPVEYPKFDKDWIYGISDWVEKNGATYSVKDLKVTSKPSTRGLGKHRLQLFTYGAAEYQKGLDIRSVGIHQLDVSKMKIVNVDEDFTRLDYDRIMMIYRQAVRHYENIVEGRGDFMIPYRGVEKCSSWSCFYYEGCPFGANSHNAREAMKV